MSDNKVIDPAKNASNQEKFDAYEWLRSIAVGDDELTSHHAAVLMYEIDRLNLIELGGEL